MARSVWKGPLYILVYLKKVEKGGEALKDQSRHGQEVLQLCRNLLV